MQCWRVQLAVHDDVRAGRAEVGGGARVRAVAAQELHFDRDGKVLVFAHRVGRLAVDHDAAVAQWPSRAALGLLADEAVLDAEHVVRERLLVEQVAEAAAEGAVVLVVATTFKTPSSTRNVSAKLSPSVEAFDLRRPAGEVACR